MYSKKAFPCCIVQELIKMAREQTGWENYREGGEGERKEARGSRRNPSGDISLGGRSHELFCSLHQTDKALQRLQARASFTYARA